MQWFFIALILFISIVIISIPMLSVQVSISAILSSSQIKTSIQGTTLFGLLHFQKDWTLADLFSNEEEKKEEENDGKEEHFSLSSLFTELKNISKIIQPFERILKRFLIKVKIEHFNWNTTIGLGDAADTGVASGVLWTVKATLASWLRNYLTFKSRPLLTVQANYQHTLFETNFECMMKIKVGNAMLTAYKLAREWKKNKKGFILPTE